MASQYRLTYFNFRGLAEPIRLLFVYLNIPYDDVRVTPEDWATMKKAIPYGKLPILEVEGKTISQSKAIIRFLARKYNLVGKDEWDSLQCDIVTDALGDLLVDVRQWHLAQDADKKKELEIKLEVETLPFYLSQFEKCIVKNGGFIAASTLTWADFYVISLIDGVAASFQLFEKYPRLKQLKETIYSIPAIAKWISIRPVTQF